MIPIMSRRWYVSVWNMWLVTMDPIQAQQLRGDCISTRGIPWKGQRWRRAFHLGRAQQIGSLVFTKSCFFLFSKHHKVPSKSVDKYWYMYCSTKYSSTRPRTWRSTSRLRAWWKTHEDELQSKNQNRVLFPYFRTLVQAKRSALHLSSPYSKSWR